MTERWPFDRSWADQWKRSWTDLLSMSSAAAASIGLPQPGTLPGDPFTAMVNAARAWLVGKRRTLRFSGREMTLTLTDLEVQGSDLARVVGQCGTVRICAHDVQWDAYHAERMVITARNVYMRPGAQLTMVAAPVLCEAFVPAEAAAARLAEISPLLELSLPEGAVPRVGVAGLPWARLEVETGAEGRSIRLRPSAVYLFDQRLPLPVPAFSLPVPGLPEGFMLTSVEAAPGGFTVHGLFSEWHRSLSKEAVERLLAAMRAGQERLDL